MDEDDFVGIISAPLFGEEVIFYRIIDNSQFMHEIFSLYDQQFSVYDRTDN